MSAATSEDGLVQLPKKTFRERVLRLAAGAAVVTFWVGLAGLIGVSAEEAWRPHGYVKVSDAHFEVLPDGKTIRQSALFTAHNSGLFDIYPVLGLQRDATLATHCAGSKVLSQAEVDQLTKGRFVQVLGYDDAPVIGRPQARHFIVLPVSVLHPGDSVSCRISYDVEGAVDQPHIDMFTGIYPGPSQPLGVSEDSWDEPRPPVYVQVALEPSTVDWSGTTSEHLSVGIYQPGEAAYLVTVKRGGPKPQVTFVCTGDNVVAVDMGDNSYLISLQGRANCAASYPLAGAAGPASFDFQVFNSKSKPQVIGSDSWIES
jgi:hypothetical protein